MYLEPWEPPGAKAEPGLIAAQQRGCTVRFDAIGVGGEVDAGLRLRATARDSAKSNEAIKRAIRRSSNKLGNKLSNQESTFITEEQGRTIESTE
jgi:hypothetical protein